MSKVFKDTRGGNYWQMSNSPSDLERNNEHFIIVYPLGGGFAHCIPRNELVETEVPKDVVSGWATFDDEPNVYRCSYNPHERWNGWHQPAFSEQVFQKIVQDWNGNLVKDDIFSTDNDEMEHWRLLCGDDKLEDDDGIYVIRFKKTNEWYLDAICWICMSDEELSEFGERWDISHIKNQ